MAVAGQLVHRLALLPSEVEIFCVEEGEGRRVMREEGDEGGGSRVMQLVISASV